MPRHSEGFNPEIRTIVEAVLGDMTLGQAVNHVQGRLGKDTFSSLRKGKVGWESTARLFAEGFWQRFCEEFGAKIEARFGRCDQDAASDWFAEKAGFELRSSQRVAEQSSEDWLEAATDEIRAAFGGHEEEMTENDRQEAIAALAAAAKATRIIQERRRQRGTPSA